MFCWGYFSVSELKKQRSNVRSGRTLNMYQYAAAKQTYKRYLAMEIILYTNRENKIYNIATPLC